MKGHVWRRLAVVAALTAALLSGTPSSRAAENIFTLPDPSGDAHAGTSLCAVDCSGLPTPVSEPSVDVRTVTVDRDGGNLVITYRVQDLDHVPPLAEPDDVAGYDIVLEAEGVRFSVIANRTAGHVPLQAFVAAGNYPDDSRRPVSASYDHAANTVRVTVPLTVLNDAVDDVCGSCHVDNGSVFRGPFVMAYLLAVTPMGQTGPVYQDIVRETASNPLVPTSDGVPNRYSGGGAFTGTMAWDPDPATCGAGSRANLSLTMTLVVSNGSTHFAGPVTATGTSCGDPLQGSLYDLRYSLHGTDPQGVTLDCPDMWAMILNGFAWMGSSVGRCTIDGHVVPKANPFFVGEYAPTAIGTDLAIQSGAVAGVLSFFGDGGEG